MPVRARFAPVALSLDVEAAYMGSVTVVIGGFWADFVLKLLELLHSFWIVIRQVQLLNLGIHVVRPEISVGQLSWHLDLLFVRYVLISQLDG